MIFYIASYNFKEMIYEAVNASGLHVINSQIVDKFDLSDYLKHELSVFQMVTLLLLDLSSLSDSNEDLISSLASFRMVYNARIIILAPEKVAGDPLLSEIFGLGIYDIIVTGGKTEDEITEEIKLSFLEGKSFKDSLQYRVEKSRISTVDKRSHVIIKSEIRSTISKALIGFTGSQERIGVTHNLLASALYLAKNKYKVSVVESSTIQRPCFEKIKDSFDEITLLEEGFQLNQIDYYPRYDLKEIHRILAKNYNFVLIDFGIFQPECLYELNRCMMQIVVAGTKPWELQEMDILFSTCSEDELNGFSFLFNFTDTRNYSDIREGMGQLRKIFFSGYTPDPFNCTEFFDIEKLFEEFVTAGTGKKKQRERFYEKLFRKKQA